MFGGRNITGSVGGIGNHVRGGLYFFFVGTLENENLFGTRTFPGVL